MPDLCANCRKRPAHPEAFGLCETCDDLPHVNAFSTDNIPVGEHTEPITTRETLDARR